MHKRKLTAENVDEWVSTEPNTGCWLWLGSVNKLGYGKAKGSLAHRVIYKMLVGEVPDGLDVMHSCHNRCCVNPAHLSVGTRKENVNMSKDAGRLVPGHIISKRIKAYYERNKRNGYVVGHNAKFTDSQVIQIRSRCHSGEDKNVIAMELNVTPQAINSIVKRNVYRYV